MQHFVILNVKRSSYLDRFTIVFTLTGPRWSYSVLF